MQTWRDTGWVSDSDDEEETWSLSPAQQERVGSEELGDGTTTERRAESDSRRRSGHDGEKTSTTGDGFNNYTIHEEFGQARAQELEAAAVGISKTGFSSTMSSPLSSLGDSDELSQPPPFDLTTYLPTPVTAQTPLVGGILGYDGHSSMAAPLRNFRTRTAIQLHPYVLEKEKHTRMFRAAGFRPVNIAASQELGHSQAETQIQQQRSDSSLPPSQASFDSSQPSQLRSSPVETATDPIMFPEDPDADLPNIEDLQRQAVPGRLPKRRKLFHSSVLTPIRRPQTYQRLPVIPSEPPTPPTSHSGASSAANDQSEDKFRLPRALGRTVLTPKTSSPVPEESGTPVQDDSDGAVQSQHQRRTQRSKTIDSGSDGPSSSENDVQFKSARKRIRGVLPASWLRFDSKATKQTKDKRTGLKNRTISELNTGRGVAQRRTVAHASPEKRSNHFEGFSDDSDDAVRAVLPPRPTPGHEPSLRDHSVVDTGFDSDEMEDNTFDAMLPSMGGKRNYSQKHRKVSSKTENEFIRPKSMTNNDRRHPTNKPEARGKHKSRRRIEKRRTRPSQPRLSIIDLTPPSPEQTMPVPAFVRVARRQARTQQDHGRHSPSYKTIRLATRADTEDAMSTLTAWRSGNMTQSEPRPAMSRPAPAATVPKPNNRRNGGSDDLLRRLVRSRHVTSSTGAAQPRIDDHFQRSKEPDRTENLDRNEPVNATKVSSNHKAPLVRRFELSSTTRARERYHPAQLEMEDYRPRFDRIQTTHVPPMNFEVTSQIQRQAPVELNFQLQRFLEEENTAKPLGQIEGSNDKPPKPFLITRSRKLKAPRRLSVEVAEFRQPKIAIPVVTTQDDAQTEVVGSGDDSNGGFQDLDTYDGGFTVDFDVRPLERGTFFHSSTFPGSGDFENVLALKNRDLDTPAGHITICIDEKTTRWSSWNDECAQWLDQIRNTCEDAFQYIISHSNDAADDLDGPTSTTTYLLRSLVRYGSSCLHFSDPVDRTSYALQFQRFLEDLVEIWSSSLQALDAKSTAPTVSAHLVDCSVYLLCLAYQHSCISDSEPSLRPTEEAVIKLFKHVCFVAAKMLFGTGCESLRIFAEKLRHNSFRDAGVKDDEVAAKFVVIVNHLFNELQIPGLSMDDLTSALWKDDVVRFNSIRQLDTVWYDVLSLQPLFAVDSGGLHQYGGIVGRRCDSWMVVKAILERCFQLYNEQTEQKTRKAAQYVQAIISRVALLFTKWDWKHCDPALAIIYDFFAKRGLAHLSDQQYSRTPLFLRDLTMSPDLHVQESDLAYHAFLKTLALGLKTVSQEYPETKLKRIAWRFIPNHGRTYRKDQDVKRSDLNALRNHHDLLCTLFWALPAGCRPRIDHIKDLVDFSTSHQEACRINVDAWRNLALFIVSHGDQRQEIGALALWFKDFSGAIVNQYRLARSEAEELFEMSKEGQSGAISFDVVQMTVTGNQRRILDTLYVALLAMQDALNACTGRRLKLDLVQQSGLISTLKIFDASQSRTFAPVLQVLNVVKGFFSPDLTTGQGANQSEESQDYGDWDEFNDLVAAHTESPAVLDEVEMFQQPVNQLLSNCFGADQLVDDSLLAALVDVWSAVAVRTVERGIRSWDQYLDSHGGESWFQLRHTDQFHKFTAFMLARVLAADTKTFVEHENVFLTQWLAALVGRESMLKFEHQLTSAMLNANVGSAVLNNLPFAVDSHPGEFNIALADLKSRRIAVIGSVLHNMRMSLDTARSNSGDMKREYNLILRQTMQAMKGTYQALAMKEGNTDNTISDAYVAFIQQVVSLMHQYTSEFCTIDSFFMDPSVFPLPSEDPKYIIARLKSYGPKLRAESGKKQLVILIQTLASNAVTSATQDALAKQLTAALLPTLEDHTATTTRPLRQTVLAEIIPAYCSMMSSTRGAAILGVPLIDAACEVVDQLQTHVNLTNLDVASVEMQVVDTVVRAVAGAMLPLLSQQPDSLTQEHMALLSTGVAGLRKTFSTVDYAFKASGHGGGALAAIRLIDDALRSDHINANPQSLDRQSEIGEYVRSNLREVLGRQWRWANGNWTNAVGRRLEIELPGNAEELNSAKMEFQRAYEVVILGQRREAVYMEEDLAALTL